MLNVEAIILLMHMVHGSQHGGNWNGCVKTNVFWCQCVLRLSRFCVVKVSREAVLGQSKVSCLVLPGEKRGGIENSNCLGEALVPIAGHLMNDMRADSPFHWSG